MFSDVPLCVKIGSGKYNACNKGSKLPGLRSRMTLQAYYR
jgi:hypothetical protein